MRTRVDDLEVQAGWPQQRMDPGPVGHLLVAQFSGPRREPHRQVEGNPAAWSGATRRGRQPGEPEGAGAPSEARTAPAEPGQSRGMSERPTPDPYVFLDRENVADLLSLLTAAADALRECDRDDHAGELDTVCRSLADLLARHPD